MVSVVTVNRRPGAATSAHPACLLPEGFPVSTRRCEALMTGGLGEPLSSRGLSAVCSRAQ